MSDISQILGQPFDPGAQEASRPREPVSPGWYNAYVEEEEIKNTQKGNGHLLSLQFCIIDGPNQNRKVFTNINLSNPSEICVKIGKADLAALTQSLNIPLLEDTSQLLNKAVQIRVIVKKDQNEIKGYKSIDQSQPVAPAVPMAPMPPMAAPPAGMVGGQGAPAPTAAPAAPIAAPQPTPAQVAQVTPPVVPLAQQPTSPPAISTGMTDPSTLEMLQIPAAPAPEAHVQQQPIAPQPPISSQGAMEPWRQG